jgi:hypothetical protein
MPGANGPVPQGDRIVDPASRLGRGRDTSHLSTKELHHDKASTTGYVLVNAHSIDHPVSIDKTCLIITSLRVGGVASK